jgi:ABC-type Fe3+-siderophore transport system permease subunit
MSLAEKPSHASALAIWIGWALLALLGLLLFLRQVWLDWPHEANALQGVILAYSTLPRGAIALLAGAALGLSGALMQRVLRNPIADPSTVGVVAGAQLAMTATTIYAPFLMETAREPVAFAGGALALVAVLALSWRRSLDPVTVVLCGMLVSLVAASLSATIILANGDYMMSLFIWGGGALEQQGWEPSLSLALRLALAGAAVTALTRPLTLLALDDANAKALGLGVSSTRLATLTLAVVLATSVTSQVGVIGFIGLAAPNFARLAGARTLSQTLVLSPILGALLLLLSDGIVQTISFGGGDFVPTGAATALLGGPLLLWLLPRLRAKLRPMASVALPPRARRPLIIIMLLVLAAILLGIATLFLGRDGTGWFIAQGATLDTVLPWRWPRILAAAAAGSMLAATGCILQRITGNAMASPEVLGVSSGAGVGLAAILIFVPGAAGEAEFAGALAGSLAALLLILTLSAQHHFGPERLLLSGVAIGALSGAIVTTVIARGGLEAMRLLDWLSGSTQRVTPRDAVAAALLAFILIAPLPFLSRWLSILPLGTALSRSIGLNQRLAGGCIILIAALLSAASALFVGPLSFVGLMAPHLARLSGVSRPVPQLAAAVLIGIVLMLFADWMARTLTFPYQLPIGLFASLVGGPYLVFILNRRPA